MPLPLRMSYNEEITTISLTRPCERSEAIQYHLLVIANVVKQSRYASNWIATASPRDDSYSSLRTQWSNPENKWIGLQVDRHANARDDSYSSTECGDCFTAGNLLKPSADTISQWGICSNRLRTPFHSGEFR